MALNLQPPDQFNDFDSVPFRDWLFRLYKFVQSVPVVNSSQLTSGPSGVAAALPTAPAAYLKVTMPDGNTYLIPAYPVS